MRTVDPMHRIGEEVTEELDYHPGSLFKRRHIRPKYACRTCEEGVHIAPMPPRPIDKGLPGPGLLAHVLTSKYADHAPLNRLRVMLHRHGVDISVATMCDWVGRMSDLLSPIYGGLKAQLLAGNLIQSDDTEAPYLLKSEKKQVARGYLWTYLAEFAFAVILAYVRELERGRRQAAGKDYSEATFEGTEIRDKFFGVLGLGDIGRRSADTAVSFGAQVGYWSRERKRDCEGMRVFTQRAPQGYTAPFSLKKRAAWSALIPKSRPSFLTSIISRLSASMVHR